MLALPDKINSERVILDKLRYEFAEEIYFTYASKQESTQYVSWPTHQSIEDTRAYLSYAIPGWTRGTEYAYAIRLKSTGRLIGSIGCLNEDGKVQFGYVLSPNFWNQGLATEACSALLLFLKSLKNVYRIWTFTDIENTASQRVLIKCGLVEEARLSRWFRFVNQDNNPKDCILFKVPNEFLSFNLVSQ